MSGLKSCANCIIDSSINVIRSCGINISQYADGANYQEITQRIIQNTVRVPASLYMSDLGALNVYQSPDTQYNVNWNQMSDRKVAHVQQTLIIGGSTMHGSSTRRTITRLRPGACSPGGIGVDIKHNSYYRYLNRLKGKGPIRQQNKPTSVGSTTIFNRSNPVYGAKTMKYGIIQSCTC
jgi:hypothetical protein